ncbi:MAG: hypothetical protein NTV70_15485 [Acidobacteria bacterium]|nr:hypothetical protein [Acidobacteriota bacterium]
MQILALAVSLAADPTLMYVGGWPKDLLVIDEANVKVVDHIKMQTDVPRTLTLTSDKKKMIAITVKDSGIETIDLASRKVVDSFLLGTGSKKVRIGGSALDPTDRYLYLSVTIAEKKIDRFEVGKAQFAVVDLQEKKITRTAEMPKEVASAGGRGQFKVSPDGKYLWAFRDNIYIFDTTDFKLVDTIQLARPTFPGMETIFLSPADDPHDAPGMMTAIFNSTDPVVHKRMWGIAKINLSTKQIDFTPVGPAVQGMTGLRLSPDRKTGYTVAISGEHGDRFTEFLVIDMTVPKIVNRASFAGRTRFTQGLTTDGKQIIIYGAGNTIEMYDSKTLKLLKDVDIAADMTTSLIPVMN